MKRALNFFTVFGVLGICIKYYFENRISLELAGVLLVLTVILSALDKPILQFIKAGVAIFSFCILMVGYSYNTNDFKSLLQPILTLLFALLGIYIMVSSLFKTGNSNEEQHFTYNKKTHKLKKRKSWW